MIGLSITRGSAPLIISIPHSGTDIPAAFEARLHSPWLARKDTDWWIDKLYATCCRDLAVSLIHTSLSRTLIDVNRDPSGQSLYPGQATTSLCPTTTFDGEDLYRPGQLPTPEEIAARREAYFDPYHAALGAEVSRLRQLHANIVVYDCHSIRSRIPRLFEGTLPNLNIGSNNGRSCSPHLQRRIEEICAASSFSLVSNGRFKGGYITRSIGNPARGVHAVQLELACRGYMAEPIGSVAETDWPPPYDEQTAAPMQALLSHILTACCDFALSQPKDITA
jgi:N-formylglutamate deformylase